MALIELDAADITRAGTLLLRHTNLTIEAGSSHVIVGPNGSGKSTLLLTLLGSRYIASGSLRYEGVDHTHHPQPHRVRAYVGQTHDAHDELLVSEAVRLYAGKPVTPASVRLGVAELWDSALGTLSAGQRVRVFLAAAIAQNPAVLLLDEPTAFLDETSRSSLMVELELRRQSGTAVVIVSHDAEATLSDSHMHRISHFTLA